MDLTAIHFGFEASLEMEVELDLNEEMKEEMKEVDSKEKTVKSLDEEEIAGKLIISSTCCVLLTC